MTGRRMYSAPASGLGEGTRASGPHSSNAALADSDSGGWLLRAPRVGIFRGLLVPGMHARPGAPIGTLTVLSRRTPVTVPAIVDGVVIDVTLHDRTQAVAYGDPLYRIAPASGRTASPSSARTGVGGADVPLAAGTFPVISPIDGVFYRGPSPGAPAFVDVGAQIAAGRTIGLVEAMKSFNAITYGGPGLPSAAVVVEIRAADASEIRQGAILMVVRAA